MARKLAWEKWYNEVEEESISLEDPNSQDDAMMDMPDGPSGFASDMFLIPRKVNTPFGVYEAGDPMCPTNLFDCWIGHSNFPICESEYIILNDKIDGIGAFKVISKYRFFIGVEKLFDFSAVRKQIESKLLNAGDDVLNFGVY